MHSTNTYIIVCSASYESSQICQLSTCSTHKHLHVFGGKVILNQTKMHERK